MDHTLETLQRLPVEDRLTRLERRDLQMFNWVRRGVRTAYLIAGMLALLVLQNTGLDPLELLVSVAP